MGTVATLGGLVYVILGWAYRFRPQAVDGFWMRLTPKGWLRGTTRMRGRMFLAIGTVLLSLGILQFLVANR